jgi:hypothetical protein
VEVMSWSMVLICCDNNQTDGRINVEPFLQRD